MRKQPAWAGFWGLAAWTGPALLLLALTAAGCQESESTQVQKARIIANENMNLKKQLQAKDLRIKELEEQIGRVEAERDKSTEDFGNTHFELLELVSNTQKQNVVLGAENQALKAELEKLRGQ